MSIDIETITLAKGAHDERDEGVCLMEAVAWWRGLGHTDHPPCVSPVLGAFGRSLNDVLPDAERQGLRRFIPLLPGTAGDGRDQARGLMAADWLIRAWLPAWLDLAGISHGLREAAPLDSWAAVEEITPALRVLREQAAAAGAAAGAAAWDAAGAAARDKLAPMVASLQASATSLFAAMITGERDG